MVNHIFLIGINPMQYLELPFFSSGPELWQVLSCSATTSGGDSLWWARAGALSLAGHSSIETWNRAYERLSYFVFAWSYCIKLYHITCNTMNNMSYFIYHISDIIYHISYIIYHISHFTYHISYIRYHITFHISHIIYQISYHISYITYHK